MLTIEQRLEGDQLILAILESAMCGKKNERRISYEWHRMVPISAFPCIFVKAAVEAIAWMKILDSVKGMMMIIVRKQFGSQTCQPFVQSDCKHRHCLQYCYSTRTEYAS
jgi:uncharacterized protein involved in tellurium resistance